MLTSGARAIMPDLARDQLINEVSATMLSVHDGEASPLELQHKLEDEESRAATSVATPRQASGRELARANEATLSSLRQQLLSAEREAITIAATGLNNDRAVSAE